MSDEARYDWQPSFLPGDQGQAAPSVQPTFFEVGPAPKQRKDLPGQRLLFEEAPGPTPKSAS
jgi:hypothetical protein